MAIKSKGEGAGVAMADLRVRVQRFVTAVRNEFMGLGAPTNTTETIKVPSETNDRPRKATNHESNGTPAFYPEVEELKAKLENAQQERESNHLLLVTERGKTALLEKQMSALKAELTVAQEKRKGHYLHLEAERKKTQRLQKQIELLEKDNRRMRESLSWAVGYAIVNTKSLRAALQLPAKLMVIFRAHKEKKKRKTAKPLPTPHKQTVAQPDSAQISLSVSPPASASAAKTPAPAATSVTTQARPKEPMPGSEALVLGWPEVQDNGLPRVMSIFDEFSRECFAPQAALIEPRPDNWQQLLARDKPEMLFVESTWRGNRSTWQYRVAKYANPPGNELAEMVAEFKKKSIPTVFWNKEDPVHFDNFIHSASQFDYVFTTAEEAIQKYQARTKAKVIALPFAAEPALHNPIGSTKRNGRVCFAGSYYANRFVERRNDQLMLLDAASRFNLDIYDRNHGRAASDFCFPERFGRFVKGSLPYTEMSRAYREYSVFLNVNSVIDSRTMFSRRVFELLACGTPIVSTVSTGIDEMFGKELVWTVENQQQAEHAIRELLNSPDEWRRRSLQGIRCVFQQHTFAHRFNTVLDTVGLKKDIKKPKILILINAKSPSELSILSEAVTRQTLKNCEISVVAKNSKFVTERAIPAGARIEDTSAGVAQLLHELIKRETPDFVWIPSCSGAYGKHFLGDSVIAATYSGASVTGKRPDGIDAYEFNTPIDEASCLFATRAFSSQDFNIEAAENGILKEVVRCGATVFAADAANYLPVPANMSPSERASKLVRVEI
jgi:spore maturation protein CgeB